MKRIAFLFAAVAVIGIVTSNAQVKTVTGIVSNALNNNPIPGVSVVISGSTDGTVTNGEGKYRLEIPTNAKALTFSFVGMKTKEVQVTGPVVNATLEPVYVDLEEVVVLGYQTKEKSEITGSVVQVNGEEIANIPVTSVDQALQGKVPGLNVFTTSGTPGSLHDIRIRGVNSITAGNTPLFVIDGVPVIHDNFAGHETQSTLSALATINSNDIESITVLKDASATSAYGTRGANGVIVITTKIGKMGDTRFNASASIGFQNSAVDGLQILSGAQKAELLYEAVQNTFGISEDQSYDFLVNALKVKSLQDWSGEEGNWDEVLLNRNAPVQNYNISASGGDAISSFYASFGYNNTEATVVGAGFERFTAKLNYNRNFLHSVRFSTNVSVSTINQHGITEPSLYFRNPHFTRYMMNPWDQPYLDDGKTLNTAVSSPVFNNLYTIKHDILTNNLNRGIANSFLEWMVIPGFKLKTLFAVDYNLAAYRNYVNRTHGDGVKAGGFTSQSVKRIFNYVSQNSMEYQNQIEDHYFTAKAILEYQENKYNILSGYGENFTLDGLTFIESAGSNFDASSAFNDWKHVSYIGILNYSFAEKYIADVTYRSEGSSKFVPGKRFGAFWAVGAGWNIHKEDFFEDNQTVNSLRLKASYGTSGNSSIGINRYQPMLSFDARYAGEGAIYPSQIGNTTLTWEKSRSLNIGLDYAFLNSFISGSFSYYHQHTYDLFQDVPISRTTAQEVVLLNAGALNNSGIEAVFNVEIIRSGDFNVNAAANIATVHNEVTELATDNWGNEINIENPTQKVAVGHPVFGWYMRKWAGVNPETGKAQWYLNGEDNTVTENYYDPNIEKVWLGTPIPKITGGVALHADFKGFFVDVGMYYAGGHKVYEDFSLYTRSSGIYATQVFNGAVSLLDRWQKPGDVTDVPKVIYGVNSDSDVSSRFLYDGDYVRLKNMVVGYDIPKYIAGSIGFEGVALSVRGTNLFTWVKDDRLVFDPEVRAEGFTSFNTPPVKSIVFGVNLNF